MRRITLYNEELDGNDSVHIKPLINSSSSCYFTKRELQEYQDQLRTQKEEYERRNKTFLSDEIKRAWRN